MKKKVLKILTYCWIVLAVAVLLLGVILSTWQESFFAFIWPFALAMVSMLLCTAINWIVLYSICEIADSSIERNKLIEKLIELQQEKETKAANENTQL